ncbi:hypothetical protein HKD37_U058512 [Glycine soja]
MIGRSRRPIEGSKATRRDMSRQAALQEASYPCGNFSFPDTSSFKFRRTKGSIGHAPTVRISTGKSESNEAFAPFCSTADFCSSLRLILGHLRYLFNRCANPSQTPHHDNVFLRIPEWRNGEAEPGSKKRAVPALPIHGT